MFRLSLFTLFIIFSCFLHAEEFNNLEGYSKLLIRKVPKYCSGVQQINEEDCQKILDYLKSGNLENLRGFDGEISNHNFKLDLYRVSLDKLNRQRNKIESIYPNLFKLPSPQNSKKLIHFNKVKIKRCLENDSYLSNKNKHRRESRDLSKEMEVNFLADNLLSMLKAQAVWDKKINVDKSLKNELKKINALELLIRDRKKIGIHSGIGEIQANLVKTRENINIYKKNKKKLDSIVFANPLLTDFTSFFENGEAKKSKLFSETLNLFSPIQKKTKGNFQSISGDEFLAQAFEMYRDGEKGSIDDSRVVAQLTSLLSTDKNFNKKYSKLMKRSLRQQYNQVENTMVRICSDESKQLHHFQPLVNETLYRKLAWSYKNGEDLDKVKREFLKEHCKSIEKDPFEDDNMNLYAGTGTAMLVAGLFTPVGWGVSLAVGGSVFAAIGSYETLNAYNQMALSSGLRNVNLSDFNKAKQDLDNFKKAKAFTVLDVALFPLDAIVVGVKISKKALSIGFTPARQVEMASNYYKSIYAFPDTKDQEAAAKIFYFLELKSKGKIVQSEIIAKFNELTRTCRPR